MLYKLRILRANVANYEQLKADIMSKALKFYKHNK
jgi:hypothetical protein